MALTTNDYLAAITRHSLGFAESAQRDLTAPVEHCPEWSVADLVSHLTGVHWFWATIAGERLESPPPQERRPARVEDDQLVAVFLAGASRLVDVLGSADQSASCWTWAPLQQDVAFVTRHQVQEVAVHHWDAAHSGGSDVSVEPELAADAVEEFLTFSVSSEADPAEPSRPALDGRFALRATDTGHTWTVSDASSPGTVRFSTGPADVPRLEGSASDLVLWLYGRQELDLGDVPEALVSRFRALCFTD